MKDINNQFFSTEVALSLPVEQFGKGQDFSTATMRTGLQERYGLTNEFIKRSRPLRSFENRYNQITKSWEVVLPAFWWTDPIPASTDACCWVSPEMNACYSSIDLDYLCLKWCQDAMEQLWLENTTVNAVDIQTPWGKTGTLQSDEIKAYNKAVFAFMVARNILLGRPDIMTGGLKPFHGVLEYMSSEYTLAIDGSNLYSALKQLKCRTDFIGSADRVLGVHPLTYKAFEDLYEQAGDSSRFPLTKRDGVLYYDGMKVVEDQFVPVDTDANLGEAWMIDFDSMGLILMDSLIVPDSNIKETVTVTEDPSQGCEVTCKKLENVGAVYSRDFNRIAKIVNIPLSTTCSGNVLQGFRGVIEPETLVPNVG